MSVVITLVHGTKLFRFLWPWGRTPVWIRDSSKLCNELRQGITEDVIFRQFEWSGGNSPSAREKASLELRASLRSASLEYPSAKHYVIAHSHGGNVALYAFRDASLLEEMSGLVCLSTPFLYAHRRSLGPFAGMTLSMFAVSVAVAAIMCTESLIASRWPAWGWSSYPLSSWSYSAVWAAYWLPYFVLLHYLDRAIKSWRGWCEKRLSKFEVPLVPARKLLVLRMSADEASSTLAAARIFNWLLGRMWVSGSNISGNSMATCANMFNFLMKHKWGKRLGNLGLASMAFLVLAVGLRVGFKGEIILTSVPSIALLMMLACTAFTILAVLMGWAGILASFLTAIFLLPLVLLMTVAMLPFGAELVLTSFFLDVSPETVPPGGSYEVQRFDSRMEGSLTHTQSYQDDRVSACIVSWINGTHEML
jgi:hypothetical protein